MRPKRWRAAVWTPPMGANPAQFSDTIIDWLRANLPTIVPPDHIIHDPFAGAGIKLGALCDDLGYTFTARDLELWDPRDERVKVGDSTLARNYPSEPFVITTSPSYNNGINDHFKPKDTSRRLTYRTALGHALHPHNTGRYSGRGSQQGEREYWRLTENCVQHWGDTVIVNVKDSIRAGKLYPLGAKWRVLLMRYGYKVTAAKVPVSGWRYGENHDAREDFEWVLVGRR